MLAYLAIGAVSLGFTEYSNCSFNNRGSFVDLKPYVDQIGRLIFDLNGSRQAIFSICSGMEMSEYLTGVSSGFPVSGAIIEEDQKSAVILGLFMTENAAPMSNISPDDGFYVVHRFIDKESREHKVVHEMTCGDEFLEPEYMSYEMEMTDLHVILHKSPLLCPIQVPAPSLKPENTQSCSMMASFQQEGFSLNMNLRKYSTEGGGTPVIIDESHIMLLEPCSAINCPPGMNCSVETANAWLCTDDLSCEGFFNNRNYSLFEVGDTSSLVTIDIPHRTFIIYKCDPEGYSGRLKFDEFVSFTDDYRRLVFTTKDICSRKIDPFRDIYTGAHPFDHYYGMKKSYSVVENNGRSEATVDGKDGFIMFSPQTPLPCPRSQCDTPIPSFLWACSNDESDPCHSFGFEGAEQIVFPEDIPLTNNSVMYLKGLGDSYARISFTCTIRPTEKKIWFTSSPVLEDNVLSFSIYSQELCNIDWHVRAPEPTTTPTPSPVQGYTIWKGNETHSIHVDISTLTLMMSDAVMDSYMDGYQPTELFMTPIIPLECPYPDSCGNKTIGNAFVCWKQDEKYACYVAADHNYPIEVYSLEDNVEGVGFMSYGDGNYRLFVNLVCSEREWTDHLVVYKEPASLWLSVYTPEACYDRIVLPTLPPSPLPTSPPAYTAHPMQIRVGKVKKQFGYLGTIQTLLKIDRGDTYEESYIYVSLNGSTDCISGAHCLGSDKGVVWKCWDSLQNPVTCYPVADERYGIDYSGTSVLIKGGYGGMSTNISFVCGRTSPKSRFMILPQSSQTDNVLHLVIESPELCFSEHSFFTPLFWVTSGIVLLLALGAGLFVYIRKYRGYKAIGNTQSLMSAA